MEYERHDNEDDEPTLCEKLKQNVKVIETEYHEADVGLRLFLDVIINIIVIVSLLFAPIKVQISRLLFLWIRRLGYTVCIILVRGNELTHGTEAEHSVFRIFCTDNC